MTNLNMEGVALHVADVEKSIAFYTRLPSARLLVHRPNEFAIIQMGQGRINLVAYGEDMTFKGQRFHFEIECDDIEKTYSDVCELGFDAPDKPARRPWGEIDFRIKDPDGNILELSVPNPILAGILKNLGLGAH
jgi:catechol 2,3-dioxygenase-like lactoylglutathione lyase family enzyme